MSGGHFFLDTHQIGHAMDGEWQDEEINELFHDLFCAELWNGRYGGLAAALDYWLSCDVSEEVYREYVRKFKEKWFNRTKEDRVEFYCAKLQEKCDELKGELVGQYEKNENIRKAE